MRIPADFTDSDLKAAHAAAVVVASEKYRPCVPGRLLPMMVARFRDEAAERLKIGLPALPHRPPAGGTRLGELTSREFGELSCAVDTLLERFTEWMDDPELAPLLRDFHRELVAERAGRAAAVEDFTLKAKAS